MQKIILLCFLMVITWSSRAQLVYKYDQSIPVINQENDTLRMPWAGGFNSPQYNTMDMDGDGDEDLVIFERTSNRFRTFENHNQQYIYNPVFEHLFPRDTVESWVILKDYNCDGKKDLFTNTIFGMKLLKNVGNDIPQWEEVANPINTKSLSGDSEVNLQVNSSDIPGIVDIDNDGDLDILVYNFSVGGFIRYHKNLSQETYGNCDSLVFQRVDSEWGDFEECECDYFAFEGQSCEDVNGGRLMHAGGKSILLIDTDADADKDLIMSQEDCNKLYFLENKGNSEDALMNEFSMQYPTENPAHFQQFPAAYYEDVTFDGIPDLLVAPNLRININNQIDFAESSWLYINSGTENNVDFKYTTNQFLQKEMIDAGENASVIFLDLDNDNDEDMLLAGNYWLQDGVYYGAIKKFENVGTRWSPSFQLVDNNFLEIASREMVDLKLSVVNLVADAAEFIIHGSVPFSFSTQALYVNDDQISSFNVPTRPGDNVLFYDIDGDGSFDLLAGKQTGNIQYYKNNGSNLNPSFDLENNEFAGIEENFLKREIYPAIADVDASGTADLITIDNSGLINVYQNFFNDELKAEAINSITLKFDDFTTLPRMGMGSSITSTNLFAQKFPSLLVGTRAGGIVFLRNNNESIADDEPLMLNIYPNPAREDPWINLTTSANGLIDVVNAMGQYVFRNIPVKAGKGLQVDSRLLNNGIYIVRLRSGNKAASKRLLVWN